MISVRDSLDAFIESVTEERLPDGQYHPSSMFLCDRQVMYGVRAVPKTNPDKVESKRNFYVGHRIHEVVQGAIESDPSIEGFWPEFRVDLPDYNVAGSGDGLIKLDDGTFVVLEIKSTKGFAARKFGLPKEEHKKQVKVYAWAARNHGVWVLNELGDEIFMEPLGDQLIGVLIVYLDKEDLNVWEYFLPYDTQWDADMLDRLNELDVYREDPDSLPPRLPLKPDGKKQWPCNYCPWKDKCWRVDPAEIEPAEIF